MIIKKVIYGCDARGDADSPYLTRYILLQTRVGELCLHVFHRSDDRVLHDHPWDFWSLILWRGYVEVLPCRSRRVWPGMILRRKAEHRHFVYLPGEKPAVTLVWKSPRRREWGFWSGHGEDGSPWEHWKAFFKRQGC